jgi:hypothetical protein
MSEMIDRVALAIQRAAIAAMREPTADMLRSDGCADPYGECIGNCDDTWRAMIDAALAGFVQ